MVKRFKDRKRQARLEKIAKAKGIGAIQLSRALRRRLTPKARRPDEPAHIDVGDTERSEVLSYAWVCECYNRNWSTLQMAEVANIAPIEMDAVLAEYSLEDCEETHRLCKA